MSLIFQYRSTQLSAWYGRQGTPYTFLQEGIGVPAPAILPVGSEIGVFGGSYLDIAHAAGPGRGMAYFARNNISENPSMSILLRIIPRFSAPSGQFHYMMNFVDAAGLPSRQGLEFYIDPLNKVGVYMTDKNGNVVVNFLTALAVTLVAGTAIDLMFAWDGTTTAGAFKFSVNGVQTDTYTPPSAIAVDNSYARSILLGLISGGPICNADINEAVIWNSVQPVAYAPRTDFTTSLPFDGNNSTDPGVANVRVGTAYIIAGDALTGTMDEPVQADVRAGVVYDGGSKTGLLNLPAITDVKSGIVFDNGTKTGTLLSTDPGVGNVRKGTNYTINSVAKAGALFAPNPSTQRLFDHKPVQITTGEDVEFLVRLKTKDGSTPLDASMFAEIEAKFLKANGSSLSLKLTTQDIFVNIDDKTELVIVMTAVNAALLNPADPNVAGQSLGTLEVITTDAQGNKVIYDYLNSLLVQTPALP